MSGKQVKILEVALFAAYSVGVAVVLSCMSCAHIQPATVSTVMKSVVKVNGPEQLVPFDDVKEGLRPLPCIQPPKYYNGLDRVLETCKYNINSDSMPAVCAYLGRKMMDDDQVFVCGAVKVQDNCKAQWRLTMMQCVLPVEDKPENQLNKDK